MFVAFILSKIRAYQRYRQTDPRTDAIHRSRAEGYWHLPQRDRCHRTPERGLVNHFLIHRPHDGRRTANEDLSQEPRGCVPSDPGAVPGDTDRTGPSGPSPTHTGTTRSPGSMLTSCRASRFSPRSTSMTAAAAGPASSSRSMPTTLSITAIRATAWFEPRCARPTATAIWDTCSRMGRERQAACATASTRPRCGSSITMTWRARATASFASSLQRKENAYDWCD